MKIDIDDILENLQSKATIEAFNKPYIKQHVKDQS